MKDLKLWERQRREECGTLQSHAALFVMFWARKTPPKHTHTHIHTQHGLCNFLPPMHAVPPLLCTTSNNNNKNRKKSWFNTNSRATKAQMGGETEWKELSGVYGWTNAFKCKLTSSTVEKRFQMCLSLPDLTNSLTLPGAFQIRTAHLPSDQRCRTSWRFYPIWSA